MTLRGLDVALLTIGGAIGVNARYFLGLAMIRWTGTGFPWATFVINVTGSFAIGVAATLLARHPAAHPARLFLIVGFLGGFTTFSSFALEGYSLWGRGSWGLALGYLAGSVAAGMAAVTLGALLGRSLTRPDEAQPTEVSVAHNLGSVLDPEITG